jgi:hypothetical protein
MLKRRGLERLGFSNGLSVLSSFVRRDFARRDFARFNSFAPFIQDFF